MTGGRAPVEGENDLIARQRREEGLTNRQIQAQKGSDRLHVHPENATQGDLPFPLIQADGRVVGPAKSASHADPGPAFGTRRSDGNEAGSSVRWHCPACTYANAARTPRYASRESRILDRVDRLLWCFP